jgi:hypothetical protein
MMDFPERKPIVGESKDALRHSIHVDGKDLFGARIIQTGTEDTIRSIDIGLQVYISEYMRAHVDKFYEYMFYDTCLHGHDLGWSMKECNCPLKTPYITEKFFEAGHFMRGVQDGVRITIARWRALELLNEWNNNSTQEAVKGKRPVRWVYFLG